MKGSFTGATSSSPGKFGLADRGTILLDEVSRLSREAQGALLRVLNDDEGEYSPVGGKKTIPFKGRILASTNAKLEAIVEQGGFARDLYYRLNVVSIGLPPLRDRMSDFPLLVDHFLKENSNERVMTVSPEAMGVLEAHNWKGNVRELRNLIKRASILCYGKEITCDFLENEGIIASDADQGDEEYNLSGKVSLKLKDMERGHILKVLELHRGYRISTAKALGITTKTLRSKLEQYESEGYTITMGGSFKLKFEEVNPSCLASLPEYFGIKEAAAALKVGESTVSRWVREGKLPAEKAGGKYILDREKIKESLEK